MKFIIQVFITFTSSFYELLWSAIGVPNIRDVIGWHNKGEGGVTTQA